MKKIIVLITISLTIISCQKGLSDKEKDHYINKGKEIAKATASHLGGEVKKKMKEGGVGKAAPFCNAQAGNFTNDIAKKFDVAIKRTSHKIRNKNNTPNIDEKKQLENYLQALATGKKIQAKVVKNSKGEIHFYAPIKIQKKCLACHGVIGKTMKKESDSIIKILYPKDLAIGFKEGDLRGMWSITFHK